MTVESIQAKCGRYQIGVARTGFGGYQTTDATKETITLHPFLMEDATASGNIFMGDAVEKGNSDDTIVKFNVTTTQNCIGVAGQDIALYSMFFQEDDNVPVIRTGHVRVTIPWDITIPRSTHLKIIDDGMFYPTTTGRRTTSSLAQTTRTVDASSYLFKTVAAILYP